MSRSETTKLEIPNCMISKTGPYFRTRTKTHEHWTNLHALLLCTCALPLPGLKKRAHVLPVNVLTDNANEVEPYSRELAMLLSWPHLALGQALCHAQDFGKTESLKEGVKSSQVVRLIL